VYIAKPWLLLQLQQWVLGESWLHQCNTSAVGCVSAAVAPYLCEHAPACNVKLLFDACVKAPGVGFKLFELLVITFSRELASALHKTAD
jgi:hypothetical protein